MCVLLTNIIKFYLVVITTTGEEVVLNVLYTGITIV